MVLGIASTTAITAIAGCLGSIREQFASDPTAPLGQIFIRNGTEADRAGELIVVRDGEIDLWRSFSIDGKNGQTVYSEQIPAAELSEPVETYQIGVNVEDIGTRWFDLAEQVPESTIERCQEEELMQFAIDISANDRISSSAVCE
ncbi:hypothetical protein [Natronorubrum texcoconense]|nr:hypothetical protein [Natronorubrum texcoconense]